MTITENETCPKCHGQTMYKHVHRLGTLEFCPACCYESTPEPINDCPTHTFEPHKARQSNGFPYVLGQCKTCGETKGSNGIKVKDTVGELCENSAMRFRMFESEYNANRMRFNRAIQDFYHKNGGKYQYYMQSLAWKEKRRQCLARDNNQCTECGPNSNLQAHHLTYIRLGNEDLSDLQTLCKTCHNAKHDRVF